MLRLAIILAVMTVFSFLAMWLWRVLSFDPALAPTLNSSLGHLAFLLAAAAAVTMTAQALAKCAGVPLPKKEPEHLRGWRGAISTIGLMVILLVVSLSALENFGDYLQWAVTAAAPLLRGIVLPRLGEELTGYYMASLLFLYVFLLPGAVALQMLSAALLPALGAKAEVSPSS